MALRWLSAVGCSLGLLLALGSAYPLYGPKRYRAPYSPLTFPMYSPRAAYAAPPYPYGQDLTADFYPQDIYDGRYRFVQVPYYFPEAATPPYYYDEEEPPQTVEDPLLEETQEVDPYLQDWYGEDANAKANAYFLKNLILAEMYKDSQLPEQQQQQEAAQQQGGPRYPVTYGYQAREEYPQPREDYDDYVYGEQVGAKEPLPTPVRSALDEDVSQLKSLVSSAENAKRQQLKKEIQSSKARFSGNTWSSEEKRSTEKKGQDEVVLPRPANAAPLRSTTGFHQRVHEPSAYDAIKKLLHVQSQQKSSGNRQPQKRSYIPNEDALVEQLGNLKKSA